MTDPATAKTALALALIATLGPVTGQYAIIFAGAAAGALLALMDEPPMQGWWPPLWHVMQGVLASVVSTGAIAQIASTVAPASWGLTPDLLWLPLAALIAMRWRDGVSMLRDAAAKKLGGGK